MLLLGAHTAGECKFLIGFKAYNRNDELFVTTFVFCV